jgi:hypothetical protein
MSEPKRGSPTGSDRNRALSDALSRVLEEKAAQNAAAATRPRRARRGAGIVLGLGLALVLAWDVWRWISPGTLPPPEEQAYALRRSVGAVAKEVLAMQAADGALPDREQVAHMLDDALTYQRIGDHFIIMNTDGEYVVTYEGALPVDEWVQNGGYRRNGRAP